jgi:hypothetical protein
VAGGVQPGAVPTRRWPVPEPGHVALATALAGG